DPSDLWFYFALDLIERGDAARAGAVLARITDPDVAVRIVSDKRFDAAAHLDVHAILDAKIASLRAQIEAHPDKLFGRVGLAEALRQMGRNNEALTVVDVALARLNGAQGAQSYSDLDFALTWAHDERAYVLMSLGRVEEALVEMTSDAHLQEN